MKNLAMILPLLVLGAWILSGCGPVRSLGAIWRAEEELERAHKLKADENPNSKYYYVASKAYLTKAKETMGRSEFEYAGAHYDKNNPFDFAERARELAIEAANRAKGDDLPAYLGRDPYDPDEETLIVVDKHAETKPVPSDEGEESGNGAAKKKVAPPSKSKGNGAKTKAKKAPDEELFE